jgi:hypothetical protein
MKSIQLACWLAVTAASIAAPRSEDASAAVLPAQTRRILSNIDHPVTPYTGAGRRAAESLNRDGERAYRKGDYDAARSAFSNSYPHFPTAFAYIMTGDSHWRAVLQFAKGTDAPSRGDSVHAHACAISNEHFPDDMLMDLDQHHEVGLALAAKTNGAMRTSEPLLQRARSAATCLRNVAIRYQVQPPTVCVELGAIEACLGRPMPLEE